MALNIIAAYDITDNRRRSRVAATLQRWGTRIQYSVFVCTLEPKDLPTMLDAVEDILDPRHDSFLVLRQCATCWDSKIVIGQSPPPPPTHNWAVLGGGVHHPQPPP
jgi:CRISPR-associated protein Cas2